MLIRTRRDLSFRASGPLAVPTPRANSASTFPHLYMRSNLQNDGTIPAPSPVYQCPDIWLAGQDPIPDYPTVLSTPESYASQSSSNLYLEQGNIIYVRARNGAAQDETRTVTLYYSPSSVLNAPSSWQTNVILTDHGASYGTIPDTAPGAVGVCDATFAWQPPPLPATSGHYCLFAQLNDAQNSNPFPNVENVFDMGALVMNNLGWGWRNTTMVPTDADWQMHEPLIIPSDFGTHTYMVVVAPVGWVGWDVEFYCSEPDSQGNPIALKRSTIVQDGQLLGVSNAVLDGGWQGEVYVNMYAPVPGMTPPAGAKVPLQCNTVSTSPPDIREAVHRGLVDGDFMYRLKRSAPHLMVGPTVVFALGAYTWEASDSTAVRGWWEQRGHSFNRRRHA